MNIKKIEEVIRLMERHKLTEITVEDDGVKIHLSKGVGGNIDKTVLPPQVSVPVETVLAKPVPEANTIEIKAPMVGTFYSSPGPDANPFVALGKKVNEGDIVCIIEAMKLMNEIKSEVKGKIVDVVAKNAEPVEFGQVLFIVEPS